MTEKTLENRTILVVSGNDGHARIDRQALKALGCANILQCADNRSVLKCLAHNTVDLILCDDHLQDMDGQKFVKTLKTNFLTSTVPVLMASVNHDQNAVLDAISSGCSGFLLRPYSLENLDKHISQARISSQAPGTVSVMLTKARNMRRRNRLTESRKIVERTMHRSPALAWFEEGSVLLMEKRWERAIEAFNKALSVNRVYAEAYEGLAHAWKGKGQTEKYLIYLKKAAAMYADQDRFMEVKTLFVEIIRQGDSVANPFFELGKSLWKGRDRKEAILALRRALKLTPHNEEVICTLAKAYHLQGEDERAVELLEKAIAEYGELELATRMLATLRHQDEEEPDGFITWVRRLVSGIQHRPAA